MVQQGEELALHAPHLRRLVGIAVLVFAAGVGTGDASGIVVVQVVAVVVAAGIVVVAVVLYVAAADIDVAAAVVIVVTSSTKQRTALVGVAMVCRRRELPTSGE